jgi:hypothetical protein
MNSLEESRLTIQHEGGVVTLSNGDTVLLEGEARNGTLEFGFGAATGILADFKIRGESGRGALLLRGAGSLQLNGVRIDPAAVEVSREGFTVSSSRWGERDCRLLFRLHPGVLRWHGTVEMSETVACVLTSPTTLNISLDVDSLNTHGREAHCVVGVTIDQIAFEFAPYPPIDMFAADEFPRVRAAVVEECERRLLRTIAELEAELSRVRSQHDANGSGRWAAEARERALRHAGWIAASEPPTPVHDRAPQPVTRVAATSYIPGRGAGMLASSYLPQDRDEPSSTRSRAAAPFGRAAYIPEPSAIVPQARVAPARATNAFPAPTRPPSSEHEAASRLLRCKDLLRALRAR